MSHTINVTDLTDQDALHRVLGEIQNHGVSYSLMQDGIEVAKVVPSNDKDIPVEDYHAKESEEVIKKRREVMKRVEILSKKIAAAWSTNETAVEAVQNNRREL